MKNKIGIIILFVIQAFAIPFALLAGFMLMFSGVSIAAEPYRYDFSQFDELIQIIVSLSAMTIGATYVITYAASLTKTLYNKKVSFISFLPAIHGVVAIIALFVWNYVNQIFK